MGTVKKVYWDACIFIAWFSASKEVADGKRTQDEINAIDQMVRKLFNYDKGFVVASSILTISEVLACKNEDRTDQEFKKLLRGSTIKWLGVDHKIAQKAHALREHYSRNPVPPTSRTLSNFDSIHLATALHYKYPEFYTFDGCTQPKRPMGLLQISENIAGDTSMKILKPTPEAWQSSLSHTSTEDV